MLHDGALFGTQRLPGYLFSELDISLIRSCLETDICVRSTASAFSMLKIRTLCRAESKADEIGTVPGYLRGMGSVKRHGSLKRLTSAM